SNLIFTWERLQASQTALIILNEYVITIKHCQKQHSNILQNIGVLKKHFSEEFKKYINDDMDMPRALALLWEVIKSEKLNPKTKYSLIMDFDKVLGLNLGKIKAEKIPAVVLKLVKERETYRKEKNFAKSDELRKKIESLGWLIDDSPSGPKLKGK
ncbi:MAG: cysteine--tRNA ligase, partial [Candidatus Azambacteria bacterium]|nr:cysteine--tRNA ligase [Candidatus Azambacteria bacterium]